MSTALQGMSRHRQMYRKKRSQHVQKKSRNKRGRIILCRVKSSARCLTALLFWGCASQSPGLPGTLAIAYNPANAPFGTSGDSDTASDFSLYFGGIFRRCFKREKDCTFYIKVL